MDALDPANVDKDREKWELVVRKMRAGRCRRSAMKRPDPDRFDAHDRRRSRTSSIAPRRPFTPPPGLHRLNRTEYANVVRDLLDLEIDPAKYLPSDDSTSGFDNIAGALGISSTLVEAYVVGGAEDQPPRAGLSGGADAGRLSHARRHVAGLSHRRAAVRHARRHARAARVPVRRRVHGDRDADLRRQHVADRLRLGAVRAARDPARRRSARR